MEKVPGPDKIDNEIIKVLKSSLIPAITDLFNAILETEIIPKQWETAEIRILYKK